MTNPVVYSKPNCSKCNATKRTLKQIGVEFDEVNIAEDDAALEFVKGLGYQEAPVVVVSEENHWSGFDPRKIREIAAEREGSAWD